MKPERIEQLLEKYFGGDSTLAEEAELRSYFAGEAVDETLLPYQPLFRHLAAESRRELSPGFEERLLRRLAAEPAPARPRLRRLLPVLARAAAVAALAIAAWWFYPHPEAPPQTAAIDWSKYEPKTPEEAYRITRTALLKVSGELNNGAAKAADEIDRVQELGRFFKE